MDGFLENRKWYIFHATRVSVGMNVQDATEVQKFFHELKVATRNSQEGLVTHKKISSYVEVINHNSSYFSETQFPWPFIFGKKLHSSDLWVACPLLLEGCWESEFFQFKVSINHFMDDKISLNFSLDFINKVSRVLSFSKKEKRYWWWLIMIFHNSILMVSRNFPEIFTWRLSNCQFGLIRNTLVQSLLKAMEARYQLD